MWPLVAEDVGFCWLVRRQIKLETNRYGKMDDKFRAYLFIQADFCGMLKKICEKYRLDGFQVVSALNRQGISDLRAAIGKIATTILHEKQATRMPIVYQDVRIDRFCSVLIFFLAPQPTHFTKPLIIFASH